MRRQIILLAGLHKTATSSIQQACLANLRPLHRAGFTYPVANIQGRQDSNHTMVLQELFRVAPNRLGRAGQFALPSKITPEQQERRRTEFAAALAGGRDRVIFVAEGVSVFAPPELEFMRNWFEGQGYTMRVMCNVRHLASWLQSMTAQRVSGHVMLTIPEAIQEFADEGGIVRPRIEALRSVFPDVEFYSHERVIRHPSGPAGFFFEAIGVPWATAAANLRANEGASDTAIRVLSLVYERFGRTRSTLEPLALQRFAVSPGISALRELPGAKFRLAAEEAASLAPLLHAENDWLDAELGRDYRDRQLAFSHSGLKWDANSVRAFSSALAKCKPEVRAWLMTNLPRLGLRAAAAVQP